jgi:hypothetical protein
MLCFQNDFYPRALLSLCWVFIASEFEPDSDSDGLPDFWETMHPFDPKNATDAQSDQDGYGYTQLEEWLNDTDPNVYVRP